MHDLSVLIGGKAGFGIDKSGNILGRLLSQLGYRIYIYRDYPSLIRGGHTFSIIRASNHRIAAHSNQIDFVLALNQETLGLHRNKLKKDCLFIYDSGQVKLDSGSSCGTGLPLAEILKEENAPEIMRNTCIIGAFCKAAGIKWEVLEGVFKKEFSRELELNLKVAKRGFDAAKPLINIEQLTQKPLPLLTGAQALALGLVKGGLKTYIAYPMTPASPVLHYLADIAGEFSLKVIHPESEIGVMLMAVGFAYTGNKVAVGTSGGGFCLMAEGLSFAAMSETPVVILMGQRPGPSTGLPTYSSQTDLHFVLNAGQGEFSRVLVAPGDAEEAYYWSAIALNMSWKYQMPSIILFDKNLSEGVFNFDIDSIADIKEEPPLSWDRSSPYKRYLNTESGVSPFAFVPDKDAIIKANSYEHDESGITIEDAQTTVLMQDKRLRKEKYLAEELESYEMVKVHGNKDSKAAILCWGSNKGVCVEAAQELGLKVIQPIVLSPFPLKQFQKALLGVEKIISVEDNATGQLARLVKYYGFKADEKILKYDGRPFCLEELKERLEKWRK